MTSLFAVRALLFAGECFAASSLATALAWLAAQAFDRASMRHLVWVAAFGALLVLPAASLLVPARFVVERQAAQPALPTMIADADLAPATAALPADVAVAPASASWNIGAREMVLGLAGLWLLGACWAAMRLALGAFGLAALRRRSRPHALEPSELPRLAATRRECELRLAYSQDGPMTWGVLRPVILLPHGATAWPRERLHAVLLHELAHVRRRDSLTRALSLAACVFYWPNPLVWMAARALRREAEIAADDAVIAAGVKPSAYAGELLSLASEFRGGRYATAGVSMAQGSALETRVKSVLEPNVSRRGVTSMDIVKTACLGIAAAALLAIARPDVVDAQNAVAPPSAPATPPTVAAPADAPAPPAADEAPEAPPLPPAVAPVDAVPPVPPTPHVHMVRRIRIDHDGHDVHVDQAEIDRAVAEAHRAEEELARIQPEIQRALAAAKIDAKVAKALAKTRPEIQAEVARAMAKVEPAIRRAMAEAKVSERVRIEVEKARPAIDAAMARARKEADEADRDDESDADEDADNDGK